MWRYEAAWQNWGAELAHTMLRRVARASGASQRRDIQGLHLVRKRPGWGRAHHCTAAAHPVNDPAPPGRQAPGGPVAQWLEPAAHHGLVAGSSPAGPTTLLVRQRSRLCVLIH